MEKILNSIEELYQLITGTLPKGYVEYAPKVNIDSTVISIKQYGVPPHSSSYFVITDLVPHDRVKIEYSKNYKLIVANGRIYKYA